MIRDSGFDLDSIWIRWTVCRAMARTLGLGTAVVFFGVVADAALDSSRPWPVTDVHRARTSRTDLGAHLTDDIRGVLAAHDAHLPLIISTDGVDGDSDSVVSPEQLSRVQLDSVTRSADPVVFHRDRRPMTNVRTLPRSALSLVLIAAR